MDVRPKLILLEVDTFVRAVSPQEGQHRELAGELAILRGHASMACNAEATEPAGHEDAVAGGVVARHPEDVLQSAADAVVEGGSEW